MLAKVLIISQSAYQRQLYSEILKSHKNIEVVGIARNEKEGTKVMLKDHPNVIVLDIEEINSNLTKQYGTLMKEVSVPTIILTSSPPGQIDNSLKPLTSKCFAYIFKPKGLWSQNLPKIRDELIAKVLKAAESTTIGLNNQTFFKDSQVITLKKKSKLYTGSDLRYEKYFYDRSPFRIKKLETNVIAIGASVGGPRTLESILEKIPKDFPSPILVVQHMSHFFLRIMVVRLRDKCQLEVKIGKNGEKINPGTIYFAHGDKHMQVIAINGYPSIRLFEGEPVNFCRPSVDVLFYSVAEVYKNNTMGILLTGMGKDGVNGLKAIKEKGGKIVAESQETAVLYGMPKFAAQTGLLDDIIPSYKIPPHIIAFAKSLT
jgi:two-component system chemotaxis response regulator CheB